MQENGSTVVRVTGHADLAENSVTLVRGDPNPNVVITDQLLADAGDLQDEIEAYARVSLPRLQRG